MKLVGINFIKTKKGANGVLLSLVGPFSDRDTQAYGERAETEFVAGEVYDAAVGSVPPKQLLGRECKIVYSKGGFVDAVLFADGK